MNAQLKQFLLALVNATLVLGIAFVVLALVVLNKAESFTANVISDVKLSLLQEVDKDVKDVLGSMKAAERDLNSVAVSLKTFVERPQVTLSPEIREDVQTLEQQLASLQSGVKTLLTSHESLSDLAVREVATVIAETYLKLRKCHPGSNP